MMTKQYLFTVTISLVLCIMFISQIGQAKISKQLQYWGFLRDHDRHPLTVTVSMTVTLYDAATGGKELWGPTTYHDVQVMQGVFRDALGPFQRAFKDQPYYVGVSVEGDLVYLGVSV